ncbi:MULTISPECIES: ribosome small subunit-dependent GTPase A [unclassified Mycoplasma]|uniref:ribosome small subunit-dependent GTPase A n=1 Tax=unclassified Mycoplasma TaxID=2683645 RepID=UPI00211D00DD|nr:MULTISPECIES: ribosome small subunit-dependent GTPase A [unclassified Mycoplasma]UUM19699.1 ribosome small subunit-dependent GTPase A [Mycoplasma sp. 1578d]UUM24682.1 ribosome small subunit-dependent GTPase A [Mycoplasma sp. 3686d]
MKGKIFSIIGGIYTVKLQDQSFIKISGAGKLRYLNLTPLVGDDVIVENNQVSQILERKNEFIRPKVANIDQMILLMSFKEPQFSSFLFDKYLSIVENKKITPILFFTKADLSQDYMIVEQYRKMNYQCYLINNNNPTYVNDVKRIFKNKYSVFMGQTGVGKTTTINKLSNNNYQTQAISKALGRGKHTTRAIHITEFNHGYLIDTPGFSSLDLDMNKYELARSFEQFDKLAQQCKFRSCLHLNETINVCAIKQAVENGSIPQFRYDNYLKLQNQLTEKEK